MKKWHLGQRLLHSLSQSSEPQLGQVQRKSALRDPAVRADWLCAVRVVALNSDLMASPPGKGVAHPDHGGGDGQASLVGSSSM